MAYGGRQFQRRRRRRSGSGLGGAVGDIVGIAANLGPRGALITGGIGFILFYFIVPGLLVLWADHTKARMSSGIVGMAMKRLVDDIFIRRFIHPSEWAAIAILLGCLLVACWKGFTRTDLGYYEQRDMTWLAKVVARFLN